MTNFISINGQRYDAVTGMPVGDEKPEHTLSAADSVHRQDDSRTIQAALLHASPQRSSTLHRRAVKRPADTRTAIVKHAPTKIHAATQTHPQVHKFAPHPAGAVQPFAGRRIMDIGPVTHPHVAKAHARSAAKTQPLPNMSAADIKANAIKNAVANTQKPTSSAGTRRTSLRRLLPRQRFTAIVSASIAVVLLGGYLTYINMPNLSVRVAAMQAGIDAGYPEYRPDGYGLNGPVTYSDGRVTMNFKANAGPHHFTVSQSKSGWDSDAVLDNYVFQRSGGNYIPYSERGLIIYTYDNNAAWVNGGILYTIEGDAPLSSEQIRRIATSLL